MIKSLRSLILITFLSRGVGKDYVSSMFLWFKPDIELIAARKPRKKAAFVSSERADTILSFEMGEDERKNNGKSPPFLLSSPSANVLFDFW